MYKNNIIRSLTKNYIIFQMSLCVKKGIHVYAQVYTNTFMV